MSFSSNDSSVFKQHGCVCHLPTNIHTHSYMLPKKQILKIIAILPLVSELV